MTRYPILVILLAAAAHAQITGAFDGQVTDSLGAVIRGARLRVTASGTGAVRYGVSGNTGYYSVQGLPPGIYEVQAEFPQFQTTVLTGLQLDAGRTLRIDLQLQPETQKDSVVVTAAAPLVGGSAGDWGASVSSARLQELPLNGRDLLELTTQEPGVTLSTSASRGFSYGGGLHVSVNGARPGQNSYRLDGIYVNDATGSAPTSAAGQTLGIEAVQELRIVTSPFLAEYGRASGAMLIAVSKSGSNTFHGSLYEYLRNSALDAKNFFDSPSAPIPPLRRNQFGGLLSGPLKRNKLFFVVNYEQVESRTAQTSIATTLGAAARRGDLPSGRVAVSPSIRPYLDLYPLPNGQLFPDGTGEYITPLRTSGSEKYFTGKLDYLRSERLRFSGRYSWNPGDVSTADPFLLWDFRSLSRHHFAQLEAQFTQSASTLHEVRAGFSRVSNANVADQTARIPQGLAFSPGGLMGAFQVTGLTDIGGATFRNRPIQYITNDYQVSYDFSRIYSRHSLRAGTGLSRVQLNTNGPNDLNGFYQFAGAANLLQAIPAAGAIMLPGTSAVRGWDQLLFYAYLQDEFRLSRSLQLSIGLRYEPYSVPSEMHGRSAALRDPLRDTETTVGPLFANPSHANFAPRAAIAWNPFRNGRTVVRAGAGIFFDVLTMRDLTFAGVRQPPFFNRVLVTRPPFPDLLSVATAPGAAVLDIMQYHANQPYASQFQVAIEHQLDDRTLLRIGYAGNRGVNLPGYVGQINHPRPRTLPDGRLVFDPTAPFLNTAFGRIGSRLTQFPSNSNSLLAHVSRRMGSHFRLQAKYNWSKTIDLSSNAVFNEFANGDYMPNPLDFRTNRGPAAFDLRHAFAIDGSFQVRRLLRGFELHGTLQAQSGPLFSPFVGFDRANMRDGSATNLGQRPNFTGTPGSSLITGDPAQWFLPQAFSLPDPGTHGNLGRNRLQGPGLLMANAAFHKTLWQREKWRATLRAEVFNVANRPNFQIPSLRIFASNGQRVSSAGRITETTTSSRQIQFAFRLSF